MKVVDEYIQNAWKAICKEELYLSIDMINYFKRVKHRRYGLKEYNLSLNNIIKALKNSFQRSKQKAINEKYAKTNIN
ncbi:unnamed protein product [Blepharisma stoltei]|uniref:Uncharacterized protein n=1 Tax=Blepharisma stoltei TaxID=1481888 RepID=A0AAU9IVH9_9CILI|nr:unnamed protein product [Blepharisma stoltei]